MVEAAREGRIVGWGGTAGDRASAEGPCCEEEKGLQRKRAGFEDCYGLPLLLLAVVLLEASLSSSTHENLKLTFLSPSVQLAHRSCTACATVRAEGKRSQYFGAIVAPVYSRECEVPAFGCPTAVMRVWRAKTLSQASGLKNGGRLGGGCPGRGRPGEQRVRRVRCVFFLFSLS